MTDHDRAFWVRCCEAATVALLAVAAVLALAWVVVEVVR